MSLEEPHAVYDDQNRRICGAKKRDGGTCMQPAMSNGRCRLHGGKTPRGMLAGSYRHGKYSKYLPAGLKEEYEAFLANPDRLHLDDELSLIALRIAKLSQRINTGESNKLWDDLKQAYRDFQEAGRRKDEVAAADALANLGKLINKGYSDAMTWSDIFRATDQYRRLIETQRRIESDRQTAVTADRAFLLIAALQEIVLRNVTDLVVQRRIADEMTKLLESAEPSAVVIDHEE